MGIQKVKITSATDDITSVYTPSANTIAVKTANSIRAYYDAGGNVTIGYNSDSIPGSLYNQHARLTTIENSATGVAYEARSWQASSGAGIRGYTTTMLQGSGGNSTSGGNCQLRFHHNDNFDLTGDFSIALKDVNNTLQERLKLFGITGRLGLGTSSPNGAIHAYVTSGNTCTLTLQSGSDYGYVTNDQTYINLGSNVGTTGYKFRVHRLAPDNAGLLDSNGSLSISGFLYTAAAASYAAITDLGWTAPIQVGTTSTGTTSNRYIPIIAGTSLSNSGYRQHTVFGSYRGSSWGSAIIAVGGNDNYPTQAFYFDYGGGFTANGTKNFRIPHPLPALKETHNLVHAAIEGPQADLIYRGHAKLVDGFATINIDTNSRMTEGTFEILTKNIQCFTTNETNWDNVRGSVTGNILTIECQNPNSNANVSWMVIAERDDEAMYVMDKENGRLIVEPLKLEEVEPQEVSPEPSREPEETNVDTGLVDI